jgi:hypothetical protein
MRREERRRDGKMEEDGGRWEVEAIWQKDEGSHAPSQQRLSIHAGAYPEWAGIAL